MRLKWILFFYFFNYSSNYYFEYVKREETTYITDKFAYINASEFSGYSTIYIKATVRNGYFLETNLFYGQKEEKTIDSDLSDIYNIISYDSTERGDYNGQNYEYYTINYYVPLRSGYNYYYFHFPVYYGNNLEIFITTSGISIGATWAIVAACIVFVIVLVLIIRCYRKNKIANDPFPIEITQPNQMYNPDYANIAV